MRWKTAGCDAFGDDLDQRLARLPLELEMKPPQILIAFGGVDERRDRQRKSIGGVGDVAQTAQPFARSAACDIGPRLFVKD